MLFLIIYLYSYNYRLQPTLTAAQQLQWLFEVFINAGFNQLICYKFYHSLFYAYITQPLLRPATIHHKGNVNGCSVKRKHRFLVH